MNILQALSTAYHFRDHFQGNPAMEGRWGARIQRLVDLLPRGTQVESVSEKRIVFRVDFHHMNADGYYDGWTKHTIVVTPAFIGFNIRVTGTNRNDIKDYLADLFYTTLSDRAPEPLWLPTGS